MEIPHSNDCRELSGRGTTHSSSQLLSFEIPVTENSIENGFLALDILGSQTNAPQACVQSFQYIICLLASPPCDMSTYLPMLLCEETCLAYDRLISHDVCNEMINGVRDTIQEHHERNPEFLDLLHYYEAFNCSNPATYGYNSTSFTECSNISCTNIFSPEVQGK